MSTRSRIAVELPDGRVKSIYCHYDGYLEHNGKILTKNYMGQAKVMALMDLGSLSSLGSELGERHDFDAEYSNTDPRSDWCRAYGRDRGEDDTEAAEDPNLESLTSRMRSDFWDEEYLYLFRGGEWYWSESSKWSDFKLVKEAEELRDA